MRKFQKKVTVIVMAIILLLLSIMMTGCIKKNDKYKETEFFRYQVFTSDGEEMVSIKGLTEKGKQLKNIVIPEEIDGKVVRHIEGHEKTPNAQKLIISYNVKAINTLGLDNGSLFINDYPAGLKVLYVNCQYIGSAVFPSISGYLATNAEESFSKHYGSLWAFEFANMQYLYNYPNSPNKDVFFIDDLDANEELEIIPETPKREGYVFTGWYAESECQNKVELDGYVKADEEIVYLYAGWKEIK